MTVAHYTVCSSRDGKAINTNLETINRIDFLKPLIIKRAFLNV